MADESDEQEQGSVGGQSKENDEPGQKGKKTEHRDAKGEQKYKEVYQTPKCNARIEELAKPNKASVKFVYKGYRDILPERNKKAVYSFIKEEFAKTPEETEDKFKKHIRKSTEKKCRKICKTQARKSHFADLDAKRRKSMIKLMEEVLKIYMTQAYFRPKHIIMTSRLRKISNIILQELCNLRKMSVPHRSDDSTRATLMFAIADFFAFCVDAVYYDMQVQKVMDYEELKKEKRDSKTPATDGLQLDEK